MILKRIGNKAKIAKEIQKYFPKHECYFEPFFGGGGMFFNKPLAKYNYLNDLESDVFNLFYQVQFNHVKLYEAVENIPYHKAAWQWLRSLQPDNDLYRAVKFCILSNWSFLGKGDTLRYALSNGKKHTLTNILRTHEFLCKNTNIQFNNVDFRQFLKEFSLRVGKDIEKTFIYSDPPYLGTDDNYSHSFKPQDHYDLQKALIEMGCKFAISEFDNEFVLQCAKENGLNIIEIGERQNLKNRRTEILITNYKLNNTLF